MLRRLLIVGVVIVALAAIGVYWFFSGDGVRLALERQATAWLGQPVRIGRATVGFIPRVGIRLADVTVGSGAPDMSRVDLS